MTDTITLPRDLVEKALAVLEFWVSDSAVVVPALKAALAAPQPGSPGRVSSNAPRTDYLTNTDRPSQAASPPDPWLCKFYQVETYPALVEAQAKHIEKLQAKLPRSTEDLAFKRVREG